MSVCAIDNTKDGISDTFEQRAAAAPYESPRLSAFDLYMQRIGELDSFDEDQQLVLLERLRAGDQSARQELVETNLGYLVSNAKKYRKHGIRLEDLISPSHEGIMIAAQTFDPARGEPFIKHARRCIHRAINREIGLTVSTVTIREKGAEHLQALKNARAKLRHQFGYNPTIEDVAAKTRLSVEMIQDLLLASDGQIYLSEPIPDSANGACRGDFIPDESVEDPSVQAERYFEREDVRQVMEFVLASDPRNLDIIKRLFGMDGYEAHTLEAAGEQYNITREAVRGIRDKAFRRIRETMQRMEGMPANILDLAEMQVVLGKSETGRSAKRRSRTDAERPLLDCA